MKVIRRTEENKLANVFIAGSDNGKYIEFVESTQPPYSINEKWILIISTLFGCPVNCPICDAGGNYNGILSYNQLKFQIDYLIANRFPDGFINTDKFKIQFARMGEPAFNDNVLEFLNDFPELYNYKYFIPSLSTIAPIGRDGFFEKLLQIKKEKFDKDFQLQFSIHSTDIEQRDILIPIKKWSFDKIAEYGTRFFSTGGKKITLNFALSTNSIIEPEILFDFFAPELFIIKVTPLNPTYNSHNNKLKSLITREQSNFEKFEKIKSYGYEIIISIGEWEENQIGSNCGQFIRDLCHNTNEFDAYSSNLITIEN